MSLLVVKWNVGSEQLDQLVRTIVVPFFTIAFDCNGFFLRKGLGCSNHYGHPKVVSSKYNYSIHLLTDEQKNIAKSVIDADASKGILWNVIGRHTGQIASLQAFHYQGTLGNDLKCLACLDGLSSSYRIIFFFRTNHTIIFYYTTQ